MVTDQLVIVRGGGDIATGTIWALRRAGFPVLILESDHPSAIRRTVALSEAVYEGRAEVEDLAVQLAENLDQAEYFLFQDQIALMVDPEGKAIRDIVDIEEKYSEWDTGLTTLEGGGRHLFLTAVVDAILAKKNLGTTIDMAPYVIALGPGFTAGEDCHVVIETMRGHNLARPVTEGSALANTGIPGMVGGHAEDRVIHSPAAGTIRGISRIGDVVEEGQVICEIEVSRSAGEKAEGNSQDSAGCQDHSVGDCTERIPVKAPFTGLLRGMIRDGYPVVKGFKIADVDPRVSEKENCFTISDKARAIGGAVVQELVGFAARKAVDER